MKAYKYTILKIAVLLILLLLSVVLVSCAQPPPNTPIPPIEVSIARSECVKSVGLEVGNILEIVLPANLSTGYIWDVGFYNQSMLKPYGDPEFLRTSTNLGTEESQKIHFEAIGEGETELVLVNQRSFENEGSDQKTFQVSVIVE